MGFSEILPATSSSGDHSSSNMSALAVDRNNNHGTVWDFPYCVSINSLWWLIHLFHRIPWNKSVDSSSNVMSNPSPKLLQRHTNVFQCHLGNLEERCRRMLCCDIANRPATDVRVTVRNRSTGSIFNRRSPNVPILESPFMTKSYPRLLFSIFCGRSSPTRPLHSCRYDSMIAWLFVPLISRFPYS